MHGIFLTLLSWDAVAVPAASQEIQHSWWDVKWDVDQASPPARQLHNLHKLSCSCFAQAAKMDSFSCSLKAASL